MSDCIQFASSVFVTCFHYRKPLVEDHLMPVLYFDDPSTETPFMIYLPITKLSLCLLMLQSPHTLPFPAFIIIILVGRRSVYKNGWLICWLCNVNIIILAPSQHTLILVSNGEIPGASQCNGILLLPRYYMCICVCDCSLCFRSMQILRGTSLLTSNSNL